MTDHAPAPDTDPTTARPGGKHPMRIPIFIAAILVGGGTIGLACRYHRPDPPVEAPAPGMTVGSDNVKLAQNAPQWAMIKVAPADAAEPHWTDAVPGRIVFDEARASRLGSPLAGRVTNVAVERGQHVKAGQALYTVASPNLADMRADHEKALVERSTAKINLERTQALVDAQSLPGKELIAAKQALAEAELAVQLSEQKIASLRVAGAGDAAFTVTAPRDGVVVEKNLSVGQEVDTSSGTVMAIADLTYVWVVADLFESDVGGLAAGAKARVLVGGNQLEGTIDQVSAVVDPERHTVPVRVKLANPEGALRPNAYAQVQFFDPTKAAVALPMEAVMTDGAKSYVYIQDGKGAFVHRDVTVGSPSNGKVPVLAGLEPKEPVVVQGAILLDNQIQLDN
ncbi:MAG TPA: efflux RND transporter periplasmic adaptor subunit [Kofleriaceae bacterium]|nr:efflux RND transporter periplasmic adaptor subunit [Kofleriaceae bacterium]